MGGWHAELLNILFTKFVSTVTTNSASVYTSLSVEEQTIVDNAVTDICPGDIILIANCGLVHTSVRALCKQPYDHAVTLPYPMLAVWPAFPLLLALYSCFYRLL